MPRVYLSEKDRTNNRIAKWVYGEMDVREMKQSELAKELGVTQQAVSQKLKNKHFYVTDLTEFIRIFEPDIDEIKYLLGVKGV